MRNKYLKDNRLSHYSSFYMVLYLGECTLLVFVQESYARDISVNYTLPEIYYIPKMLILNV